MSQDNQFHQYGYDHYLKAPRKNRSKSGGGIGSRIFESLQSPMVATGALLVTGVVFATIIVLAYPSADDPAREIPIVRADLGPVKTVPDDLGVTEFPNTDNTVLANIGQPRPDESTRQVENLMAAPPEEDFVSKEQALEQAMATQSPEADPVGQALNEENVTPTLIQEAQKLEPAAGDVSAPNAESIIRKIDETQEQPPQDVLESAAAETPEGEDKRTMHAAATSPETIDFVRSVLNADNPDDLQTGGTKTVKTQEEAIKDDVTEIVASEATAPEIVETEAAEPEPVKPVAIKDAPVEEKIEEVAVKVVEPEAKPKKKEEPKAKEVAKIAPAAGAASSAINIKSGTYYVQLASITDRSRADKEYTKLQKKFTVLDDIDFRVQEANLDRGMFYRIQAGPMSKDSAKQVCAEIKKQKPEGCIVTK